MSKMYSDPTASAAIGSLDKELERMKKTAKELREKRKAYNNSVKGLKNSIQVLESSITEQVLESGKTVSIGSIRAEYKPTVVIKIARQNDGNADND